MWILQSFRFILQFLQQEDSILSPLPVIFNLVQGFKGSNLVAVYDADDEMLQLGRQQYRRDLDRLAACIESDNWPSYNGNRIEQIGLPVWAKRQLQNILFDDQTF